MFGNKKYSDEALISMICSSSNKDRDKAMHYIYVKSGWREIATSSLLNKGNALPDIKEAIQEALIILDRNVRAGKFDSTKSLKNYFIGICEGRIFSNKRSRRRWDAETDLNTVNMPLHETPETDYLDNEEKDFLRQLLKQLETKCEELLKLYMLSFSMREIKEKMGFKTDEATRKAAFDCRKKFAQLCNTSPIFKKYFEDLNNE